MRIVIELRAIERCATDAFYAHAIRRASVVIGRAGTSATVRTAVLPCAVGLTTAILWAGGLCLTTIVNITHIITTLAENHTLARGTVIVTCVTRGTT